VDNEEAENGNSNASRLGLQNNQKKGSHAM